MFADYELSSETVAGLKKAGFLEPTEIQKQTLKPALEGKDILASAKTGSGKTLAFIIPLLECLYKEKWSRDDGLGALVITPTRELAQQIFEVLNLVGQRHQFSAALIVGGKDLAMERKRIDQMNIIICTPGRLTQHMEENPLFYGDNLKILILDEADRMLARDFEESMSLIVDFLPKERQCLLFSATQTKSVKKLARMCLKDPVVVDVDVANSMPEKLTQRYTVINLEQKMSLLWKFLKTHTNNKILVFISTCKLTRYIHDLFRRPGMRPGITITALYGSLHQQARMEIYNEFCSAKQGALLATDIAARGLDFPNVDWVFQLDCPSDAKTYIHRVGRTARIEKPGKSLLILMPNEKDHMIKQLDKNNIFVEEVPPKEKHLAPNFENRAASCLASDPELHERAKKAFTTYIKSLLNTHFKERFDLKQLDLKAYAKSLGLGSMPRIRVLERGGIKINDVAAKRQQSEVDSDFGVSGSDEEDEDGDFMKPAKKQRLIPALTSETTKDIGDIEREKILKKNLPTTKLAKKLQKKGIKVNKRIVFDKD